MVINQAILQQLINQQSEKSGAMVETWQNVTTIPVQVFEKKTTETIKGVKYYKTTTIITKYPNIQPILNRLVINNNIYLVDVVVPGAWTTLTSYTITTC